MNSRPERSSVVCRRDFKVESRDKGRTIRKVMGGGGGRGIFSLHDIFFSSTAYAGIFFFR